MYCTRCGSPNDEGAEVCRNCTAPLVTRTTSSPPYREPCPEQSTPRHRAAGDTILRLPTVASTRLPLLHTTNTSELFAAASAECERKVDCLHGPEPDLNRHVRTAAQHSRMILASLNECDRRRTLAKCG
jgi:hypothetical protein